MTTKLGRWCLRTSEVYGKTCNPEIKQLQNIYDHGFTTMNPQYFPKNNTNFILVEKKEESVFERLRNFTHLFFIKHK